MKVWSLLVLLHKKEIVQIVEQRLALWGIAKMLKYGHHDHHLMGKNDRDIIMIAIVSELIFLFC